MPREVRPLNWPFKGVNKVTAYSEQPDGTCPDALNVRTYDALGERRRGGQRRGMSRYFATSVNASNAIQRVVQGTQVFDVNQVIPGTVLSPDVGDPTKTDDFVYADGTLETVSSAKWKCFEPSTTNNLNFLFGTEVEDSTSLEIVSNKLTVSTAATADFRCTTLTTKAPVGTGYVLKYVVEMDQDASATAEFYACWRMLDDPSNPGDSNRFSGYTFRLHRDVGAGTVDIDGLLQLTIPGSGTTTEATANAITTTSDATFTATIEIIVNVDTLNIKVNNIAAVTNYNMASLSGQNNLGIALERPTTLSGAPPARVTSVIYATGITPISLRTTKIVSVSGGDVYSAIPSDSAMMLATSGTNAVKDSGFIDLIPAFQRVFMCDGESTGYKYLDLATDTVSNWQDALTAGSLPVGGQGAGDAITAINTATPSFSVNGNKTSTGDGTFTDAGGDFIEIINSGTDNDGSYTTVSAVFSSPNTILTVNQTIQSATVAGSLRLGTIGCRFGALYRGRIVLSGFSPTPENWFMSRLDDPFDWDYFPATTDETQPVAGNNSNAGLLGDIVTALIPWQDDVLYIGGDHTVWAMSGDPAAGGRLDKIAHNIGILGPKAWTIDTQGNIYWMGQNGLYRIRGGTVATPENVSRDRLATELRDIDFALNLVLLEYDRDEHGIHIYITQQVQPSTVQIHYFWDEREDAFWIDEYPSTHGPTDTLLFDADAVADRALILGGYDSFLRTLDSSKNDDTDTITSTVDFRPEHGGDRGEILLTELTINASNSSDSNLVASVFADETQEEVVAASTAKYTKTLTTGRNNPILERVVGNAVMVRLQDSTASSSWAYENGSMIFETKGVVRRDKNPT